MSTKKPHQRERDPLNWDDDEESSTYAKPMNDRFENLEKGEQHSHIYLDMSSCQQQSSISSLDQVEEKLFQELREYRDYLNDSSTLKEIDENFKLFYLADKLQEYYGSRPNLSSFTMNKDLHRMDYTVYNYGEVISDLDVIRKLFPMGAEDDMLFRCANQSLLVDAILSLTGERNVVRNQYLATGLANRCHFIICLGLDQKYVKCYCDLVISMPVLELELATLRFSVFYSPSADEPIVSAHALHLETKEVSDSMLRTAARLIMRDMHGYTPSKRQNLFCNALDFCDPNKSLFLYDHFCDPSNSLFTCDPNRSLLTVTV